MGYSTKSCQFALSRSTYVTVGNNLSLERTDTFSISFWAKWSVTGVSSVFVGKQDNSSVGYAVSSTATGQIEVVLVNTLTTNSIDVVTTATGFNNGVWHHICVTYGGSSSAAGVLVYVDGTAQTKTVTYDNLSASMVSTASLYLGARSTSGSNLYLTGAVDEVAFYNVTLSAAQVTAIYDSGDTNNLSSLGSAGNLVGWWRMGDGDTYPTLTDASSGGHNGTMTSMGAYDIQVDAPFHRFMVTEHSDWRFKTNIPLPYSRKSLTFTAASSKYVDVGNNLSFERTNSFSISFWAKWSSSIASMFVAKCGEGTTFAGYQVDTDASGHVEFWMTDDYTGNNYLAVATTSTFNNGAWHHVCVSYSGTSLVSGVSIYVDGSLQSLTTLRNTLSSSIITTATLQFGGRSTSTAHQYLTGLLDEVSFYNIALSSTQAAALYNSKLPTNLLTVASPPPANLIGWWRMGDGDTYPTLADNSTGGHNGTMINMSSGDITSDWPTSGDNTSDRRNLLKNIKDALTTSTGWTNSSGSSSTVSSTWQVVASSNGTVANTSDNWNTLSDIVFNSSGSAHSWIVLRQTGINGLHVEWCLDCGSASRYNLSVICSLNTGFNLSSLNTSNRPVAPDEAIQWSGVTWFNSTSAFNAVLNVCMTSDGKCTRFWGLVAGACKTFWLFDRPTALAGWSNPSGSFLTADSAPLYTGPNDNAWLQSCINGMNVLSHLTAEFYVSSAVGQSQTTVNSVSNEWPINRIGIACTTSGAYGRHGEMSDIWWGSTTPSTNDTYPASGTLKQFIHIGNMVLPWNLSTPVST